MPADLLADGRWELASARCDPLQDVRIVLGEVPVAFADGLQAVVGDEDDDGADGDAVEGDAIEAANSNRPTAMIMVMAATMTLTGFVEVDLFSTQMRMPTMPIMPYSRVAVEHAGGDGVDDGAGTRHARSANAAAHQYAAVEVTLRWPSADVLP